MTWPGVETKESPREETAAEVRERQAREQADHEPQNKGLQDGLETK